MYKLFLILFFISFSGLIIGLLKPRAALKWGNKRTRGQVFLIYGLTMAAFFVSYILTTPQTKGKITSTTDTLIIGTKHEDKFKLSESKRKIVWTELVLVDDRAAIEAEARYPIIDPTQSLHEGKVLKLTKETPLMPELEPKDAMAALQRVLKLPPRTTIKVLKIAMKQQNQWYFVKATSPSKNYIGTGWINSLALTGQLQFDVSQQAKQQTELEDLLKNKYENELAKKYGLTHKQLESINIEGLENNWPLPGEK